MIWILYNFVLLLAVILFAPLWLIALGIQPKFRSGFWQKCGFWTPFFSRRLDVLEADKPRIWLHVVSVGELNAASVLIESLTLKGWAVIISTTTATGQSLAKKRFPNYPVFYFPFDLPWLIDMTLKRLKATIVVVLETEIWPNLAWRCRANKTPLIMLNGRLSQRSMHGYKRFGWFFKKVLGNYSVLAMQSEPDEDRMAKLIGHRNKLITLGNLKFDNRIQVPPDQLEKLKESLAIQPHERGIVLASSHAGEEKSFIQLCKQLQKTHPNIVAFIVPRHPERFKEVSDILTDTVGWDAFCRRSALLPHRPRPESVRFVLMDAMGELFTLFHLAYVAVMGGTFVPVGGHNPLEPIQANIPVIFGPSMENFEAIARLLLKEHAAIQAKTYHDVDDAIHRLMEDDKQYKTIVAQGQTVLTQYAGVVQKAVDVIDIVLKTGDFHSKPKSKAPPLDDAIPLWEEEEPEMPSKPLRQASPQPIAAPISLPAVTQPATINNDEPPSSPPDKPTKRRIKLR